MGCGCETTMSNSTPARLYNGTSDGEDPGAQSYGTVLDNTIGLVGIVEQVVDAKNIVVRSFTTDGSFVRMTLEEGQPGIFEGIEERHFVFCAVSVHQRLAQLEIRGVCFWILDFGVAPVGQPLDPDPSLNLDVANESFTNLMKLNPIWSTPARSNQAFSRVVSKLGRAVDAKREIVAAVCVIATMKALLVASLVAEISTLFDEGYLPVGIECFPGLPGSVHTGFINVVFRFRNDVQDERSIVVAVKLSTWAAADRLDSQGEDDGVVLVREFLPKVCLPRCQACKVACRIAQAAAVAACPDTGPLAVVCVAAALEAGEQCYNGC